MKKITVLFVVAFFGLVLNGVATAGKVSDSKTQMLTKPRVIQAGPLSATCESDNGSICVCKGGCTASATDCKCDHQAVVSDKSQDLKVNKTSKSKFSAPGPLQAKCTSDDKGSTCDCPGGSCKAGGNYCECVSSVAKEPMQMK
ncbi:MAG: hypothetical protein ACN4GR_16035 [Arenicellales bacterium]